MAFPRETPYGTCESCGRDGYRIWPRCWCCHQSLGCGRCQASCKEEVFCWHCEVWGTLAALCWHGPIVKSEKTSLKVYPRHWQEIYLESQPEFEQQMAEEKKALKNPLLAMEMLRQLKIHQPDV